MWRILFAVAISVRKPLEGQAAAAKAPKLQPTAEKTRLGFRGVNPHFFATSYCNVTDGDICNILLYIKVYHSIL